MVFFLFAVPLIAPPNLSGTPERHEIYAEWDAIPYESRGGNLLGYQITIYEYGSNNKTNLTSPYYSRQKTFIGLKAFTMYVIEVCGYTSPGSGPKSVIYRRTLSARKYFHIFNYTLHEMVLVLPYK